MTTILVTGAAGFIGSHLSERLLRDGHRVVGIDNFNAYYNPALKERNIEPLQASPSFTLKRMDICEAEAVKAVFAEYKPQAVIHLAAWAGVRPSIQNPSLYSQVNVQGTVHLLDAAVEHKTERFLFASSSSVYGNCPQAPFSEEEEVNEPISPYAATKRAGELLAHTYWHLYKLPIACLRFFTVFGPRQRPDLAIHKFMRMIANDEAIPVFGDGSSSRDYTFVEDIVEGIVATLEKNDRYRIYNIGGSQPVTLSEMIASIEEVVGKSAIIHRLPMQPGDVRRTYADLTRSTAELGYAPSTSFREGLRQQWAWMQEELRRGRSIT
jgi:UDP-glucuronate 4-epimerase